MIIYSELTGETYNSAGECINAEVEFKKLKMAEEAARKVKEAKLDEAYKKAVDACNEYMALVEECFGDIPEDLRERWEALKEKETTNEDESIDEFEIEFVDGEDFEKTLRDIVKTIFKEGE